MGVFSVAIEVSNLDERRSQSTNAWVDTGGFYSSFPRAFLEGLGVVADRQERFMLADGRLVDSELGYARIKVGNKSVITLAMLAEPDSPHILGAYTLEGLALAVDTVGQQLVPMPWLLLAERVPA